MRMQFMNKDQFVFTPGVTHYDDAQTGISYFAMASASGTPPVITYSFVPWNTGDYPQVPNVFQGVKTAAQQGTTAVTTRAVS